jgi:hypothetical protein
VFLDNVHSQVLLGAVLRFFKTSFSQPLVPTSKREGVRNSRVWARGGFGLLAEHGERGSEQRAIRQILGDVK